MEEALAALEWKIPIEEWYIKPRAARATMAAAIRARAVITYYSLHEDD